LAGTLNVLDFFWIFFDYLWILLIFFQKKI
jgi:hypothetical protein